MCQIHLISLLLLLLFSIRRACWCITHHIYVLLPLALPSAGYVDLWSDLLLLHASWVIAHQYSHRAYSCVSTEEQESVHHYLHDVPTNLGFRKLFASFVGFVPYHISIFDKLIYSTMKLILLLTAISSAAGFMPQGAVRQTTPLEMVSFGIGPDAATPDPTRTVDLNTKGVMIDPDYRFSKNLAAFSAGAMMMYPSKFFYIFLASSFIMSFGMSCL